MEPNRKRLKHFRYCSVSNPWMDCIITVSMEDAERAKEEILDAIDMWWEEDWQNVGYGQAIELALADAEILYNIRYHDPDIDESSDYWDEYQEFWGKTIPKDCESI